VACLLLAVWFANVLQQHTCAYTVWPMIVACKRHSTQSNKIWRPICQSRHTDLAYPPVIGINRRELSNFCVKSAESQKNFKSDPALNQAWNNASYQNKPNPSRDTVPYSSTFLSEVYNLPLIKLIFQVARPLTMKKDGIQTRNRKLSAKSKGSEVANY